MDQGAPSGPGSQQQADRPTRSSSAPILPDPTAAQLLVPGSCTGHRPGWGTSTTSEELCRRYVIGARDTTNNVVTSWLKPCNGWGCETCGPQRIRKELRHAEHCFRGLPAIWHAVIERGDNQLRDRIKQRRRRARAEYLMIRRWQQDVHIFSTANLSGRLAPTRGTWLDPQAALDRLAQEALLHAGIVKLSWSVGWRASRCHTCPQPAAGRWKTYGLRPRPVFERAFSEAADEAEERYGVRPEVDVPLPPSLPALVFDQLLLERLHPEGETGPDVTVLP